MMLCDFIFLFLSVYYPQSDSVGCLETCSRMHENDRERSGKPLRS